MELITNEQLLKDIVKMRIITIGLFVFSVLSAGAAVYSGMYGNLFPSACAYCTSLFCFIRHETLSIRYEIRNIKK